MKAIIPPKKRLVRITIDNALIGKKIIVIEPGGHIVHGVILSPQREGYIPDENPNIFRRFSITDQKRSAYCIIVRWISQPHIIEIALCDQGSRTNLVPIKHELYYQEDPLSGDEKSNINSLVNNLLNISKNGKDS